MTESVVSALLPGDLEQRCDFCRYVAVFFRRSGAASAAVGILIIGSSRAI